MAEDRKTLLYPTLKNPRTREIFRFFGMWAPSQSLRVAMYRKAGVRIGNIHLFGSGIWIDINLKNMITIEDGVLLSGYIQILSHSFIMHGYKYEGMSPVIIKRGARIGLNALLLPGVTIGENSVIGARAVVANDIPPNCLAVGVPAKPVKYFKSDKSFSEKTEKIVKKEFPVLYLKCKTCQIEFWSLIRCDTKIFKTLELREISYICPNGHKNQYDEKDYYF